jgi:hypothetical protein
MRNNLISAAVVSFIIVSGVLSFIAIGNGQAGDSDWPPLTHGVHGVFIYYSDCHRNPVSNNWRIGVIAPDSPARAHLALGDLSASKQCKLGGKKALALD